MNAAPKLPLPLLENWTWQVQAACRGLDPAVFFYAPDEPNAPTRVAQTRRAKAVCERCPVVAACLEHALQTREPYGVWGGRSEAERAELLGLDSLRYPARRARARRQSAASRREAWRSSAGIGRATAGPAPNNRAPSPDIPAPLGVGADPEGIHHRA